MADLHLPEGIPTKSLVVYAHGINGFKDWGGMDLIAAEFARQGHAFLKFNFSHNGTTAEKPEEFVDLEAYGNDNYGIRQSDLKAVADHIITTDLAFHHGITLIGHSRGGTDAILYAPKDERISRVITWAAAAQAKTPWQNWSDEELAEWRDNGVRFRRNSRTGQNMPLFYQLYLEYQQDHRQLNVEQAARSIQKPWLIVHAADDESVFVKDAYSLKEWQPDAEVYIVKSDGHTFGRSHPWNQASLPEASAGLVKNSVNFIERSLPQD